MPDGDSEVEQLAGCINGVIGFVAAIVLWNLLPLILIMVIVAIGVIIQHLWPLLVVIAVVALLWWAAAASP
jgi:hypothetical protein